MKIYNEDGTQLMTNPDLKKGWLEQKQQLVQHHPAQEEISHTELMFGTNGLRHLVIEQPKRKEWDEYEHVLIYHPYTSEELAEKNRLNVLEKAVLELMLKQGGASNV